MNCDMLPDIVAANYRRMVADSSLNERERAFFTDNRLKKFWAKVGAYLSGVRADYRYNAASQLVAGFLSPLQSGYGETGKASNPTIKTNIRAAQNKADKAIKKIVRLAGDLATALDDLEPSALQDDCVQGITRFAPDETRLLVIVKRLIDEDGLKNLPSYCGRVRTSEALRILEKSFSEYPEANELFKDVPGMASQKSTWADWMREAEENMNLTLSIWPGKLELKEVDWVNLAQVLIGEHINRNAVRSARREL